MTDVKLVAPGHGKMDRLLAWYRSLNEQDKARVRRACVERADQVLGVQQRRWDDELVEVEFEVGK